MRTRRGFAIRCAGVSRWGLLLLAALLAACVAPGTPPSGKAPAASGTRPEAAPKGADSGSQDRVAEFFRGKTITIIASSQPGGGVSTLGRVLANRVGEHMPGKPRVIVQDMPGGAGAVALNHVFSSSVQPDGLTWVAFGARGPVILQMKGGSNIRYDLQKAIAIGSADSINTMLLLRRQAPEDWSNVQAIQRARVKPRVGGNVASSPGFVAARLLEYLVGQPLFQYAAGYGGNPEILVAIERGEVDGWGGPFITLMRSAREQWEGGAYRVLVQVGLPDKSRDPKFAEAPTLWDFVKTEEHRQIMTMVSAGDIAGRPYFLPPGVPEERVAAIRKAFWETINSDSAYRQDAEKAGSTLMPVSGEEMAEIYTTLFTASESVRKKFLDVVGE